MRRPGKTPPFKGPHGEPLAGSIAHIEYLRLGGVEQWVMIRGENVANPPLILLHGGPGLGETAFFRHFNAPLEKVYTVVYWDQRGAGKSYDPDIPKPAMTLERFVSDLGELVDAVCKRLGQTQVVILGHSWGSALGTLYAARSPEKVATYVGCAQIGDWGAGESISYAYALAEAQRHGRRRAVEKLREIGPPPHSAANLLTERTLVMSFAESARAMWSTARAVLAGSESSILELPDGLRGFRFSLEALWPEVCRLNLLERVPRLPMPAFFLLGRKDHWVPPEASMAYIEALTAPSKEVIWFERSGHEMFVDEPDKFNAVMIERVLSVVQAEYRHSTPGLSRHHSATPL